MARITRESYLSGVSRTLDIPQYDQIEFERRLHAWREGKVSLQEALPDVSFDALEFIRTGVSKEEWERYDNGEYMR
jgi:hypothetical protein